MIDCCTLWTHAEDIYFLILFVFQNLPFNASLILIAQAAQGLTNTGQTVSFQNCLTFCM